MQLSEESVWAGQPVEQLPVCKSQGAGTKVQMLTAVFTGTKVQILVSMGRATGRATASMHTPRRWYKSTNTDRCIYWYKSTNADLCMQRTRRRPRGKEQDTKEALSY